tara:strand:+ start:1287 stop:1439 length:153 start_codon:yes stop_codon:yes gene_type:complete
MKQNGSAECFFKKSFRKFKIGLKAPVLRKFPGAFHDPDLIRTAIQQATKG